MSDLQISVLLIHRAVKCKLLTSALEVMVYFSTKVFNPFMNHRFELNPLCSNYIQLRLKSMHFPFL